MHDCVSQLANGREYLKAIVCTMCAEHLPLLIIQVKFRLCLLVNNKPQSAIFFKLILFICQPPYSNGIYFGRSTGFHGYQYDCTIGPVI